MDGRAERRDPRDPRLLHVVLLGASVAGLALCITLQALGMRAVMDIGGACAEGGPYVPVQPCPDGAPLALMLGSFGLFVFGALVLAFGSRVGGWGWLVILGWTGLFAVLGWNFLDYGIVNPPEGEIVWGWLIPGVIFQVMAFAPLVFLGGIRGLISAASPTPGSTGGRPDRALSAVPLPGPRQPGRAASPFAPGASVAGAGGGPDAASMPGAVVGWQPGDEDAKDALAGVAAALGAAVREAGATTTVGEVLDGTPAPGAPGEGLDGSRAPGAPGEFAEGTQALLDRLERLADLRADGLLDDAEYETAKDAVLRELEARRS